MQITTNKFQFCFPNLVNISFKTLFPIGPFEKLFWEFFHRLLGLLYQYLSNKKPVSFNFLSHRHHYVFTWVGDLREILGDDHVCTKITESKVSSYITHTEPTFFPVFSDDDSFYKDVCPNLLRCNNLQRCRLNHNLINSCTIKVFFLHPRILINPVQTFNIVCWLCGQTVCKCGLNYVYTV